MAAAGTFYEGVMTSGYPSDATENAVQANIVARLHDVIGPAPVERSPPARRSRCARRRPAAPTATFATRTTKSSRR
ncbi:arabinofuranosidase catalytic domain-containing protein [Nonomuraea sp. NPDC049625]|uniref:arabinofuranosidase catalytic domain-containing protein n=1 Tax=Nonomuraea sp. NPDC049625 TaxID=3155775 RepID=UPI00342CCC19